MSLVVPNRLCAVTEPHGTKKFLPARVPALTCSPADAADPRHGVNCGLGPVVLRAVGCGASPAVQASVRGAVVATFVGDSVVAAGTPLAQHLRSLLGTPGASSALLTLVTVVVACGPR